MQLKNYDFWVNEYWKLLEWYLIKSIDLQLHRTISKQLSKCNIMKIWKENQINQKRFCNPQIAEKNINIYTQITEKGINIQGLKGWIYIHTMIKHRSEKLKQRINQTPKASRALEYKCHVWLTWHCYFATQATLSLRSWRSPWQSPGSPPVSYLLAWFFKINF